jgi:hypothetical protein
MKDGYKAWSTKIPSLCLKVHVKLFGKKRYRPC